MLGGFQGFQLLVTGVHRLLVLLKRLSGLGCLLGLRGQIAFQRLKLLLQQGLLLSSAGQLLLQVLHRQLKAPNAICRVIHLILQLRPLGLKALDPCLTGGQLILPLRPLRLFCLNVPLQLFDSRLSGQHSAQSGLPPLHAKGVPQASIGGQHALMRGQRSQLLGRGQCFAAPDQAGCLQDTTGGLQQCHQRLPPRLGRCLR